MPKIGMRIIKSSVAVFLCFAIYLLRGDGIPFYSAIAAVLCMQPYVSNSRKVAFNRTIGTFIGGIFGMVVMLIEKQFIPLETPILKYLLISIVIIPVIYSTVLVKKPTAAYIGCVVFMSITVSHGLDANPYLFALNRIIDTLIGIFVSLGVNAFHLPRQKNSQLLFVSDLDGTLTNSEGKISSYTKIKLNQLIQKGAMVTVASERSSATIAPIVRDIHFNIPIITLNGAALYDLTAKTYLYCKTIPYDDAEEILGVFEKYGLNCFVHTIINDILHIYYGNFTNPVEEKMYHENKLHPLKNYIYSPLPENRDVVYFRAADTSDMVKRLYGDLLLLKCRDKINVVCEKNESNEGYSFLEIYSAQASKANAVFELSKRLSIDRTAAFGNGANDIAMIEDADYGYAVENATDEIKEMAPNIIGDRNSDAVVKTMEKLFHSKKLI
jgi:Cof subfamily protein (haloacid dehalogenase superfamily)